MSSPHHRGDDRRCERRLVSNGISTGFLSFRSISAFTEVYVADAASTAGPWCPAFVDDAIFDGAVPTWVSAGGAIPFRDIRPTIQTTFLPVTGVAPPGKDGVAIPGVRDAHQIAETSRHRFRSGTQSVPSSKKATASGHHAPVSTVQCDLAPLNEGTTPPGVATTSDFGKRLWGPEDRIIGANRSPLLGSSRERE
jgi:hypothetical protein